MALYLAQNLKEVTISGTLAQGATTVTLSAGDGAKLASTAISTFEYPGTVYDTTSYGAPHLDPNAEIILVTSHDGASDTIAAIARGQEGTSDVNHTDSGHTYKIVFGFTKDMFDTIRIPDLVETSDTPFGVAIYRALYAKSPFATSTQTCVANQIYAMLFKLEKARTIDSFWVRFNTAQTGSVRTGFYAATSDTNPYPGALVAGTDTLLSYSNQSGSTASVNLTLQRGWYWQVFFTTQAAAVFIVPVAALHTFGSGFATVAGPTQIMGLKSTLTFASLPDPFPAGASLLTTDMTNTVPFVGSHFSA